jgi:hypothetical protein
MEWQKRNQHDHPVRRAPPNSTLTVIILIGVIVFGLYYSITGRDVLDIFTPTEEPPPPVEHVSTDWWEVYFADPLNINNPDDWQNSIEARLIDKINLAQTSIHIASFRVRPDPGR